MDYIFTSERLGFRNWLDTDLEKMAAINADSRVMEFFPSLVDREGTVSFIDRMKLQLAQKGYCYYAVDDLADQDFIGFIGLSTQTYEAPFTPCVDIGWRLKTDTWNKGLATEGAKRCLLYAFKNLGLKEVFAIAPVLNLRSERIMQKIGMQKLYEFVHPLLHNDDRLKNCNVYSLRSNSFDFHSQP